MQPLALISYSHLVCDCTATSFVIEQPLALILYSHLLNVIVQPLALLLYSHLLCSDRMINFSKIERSLT